MEGCRDSNPRCCDRSQMCYQWANTFLKCWGPQWLPPANQRTAVVTSSQSESSSGYLQPIREQQCLPPANPRTALVTSSQSESIIGYLQPIREQHCLPPANPRAAVVTSSQSESSSGYLQPIREQHCLPPANPRAAAPPRAHDPGPGHAYSRYQKILETRQYFWNKKHK